MSPSSNHSSITGSGAAALRTLLLTDFVSSTELIETLGDKRAAKLFAVHDRKARDILASHKGIEIDKTDGFLFLFTRPIDAVKFSLNYHDMLRVLSQETDTHLLARAGVHVGEVILRRNDPADVARGAKPVEVDGLSKHAAARVMSVALGGQTLMTGPTYEFAKRGAVGETELPDDLRWICHGSFQLKGIEEPVPLYEVGREGLSPLRPPPDGEKVQRVGGSAAHRRARSRIKWLGGALVGVGLSVFILQVLPQDSPESAPPQSPTETVAPSSSPDSTSSAEPAATPITVDPKVKEDDPPTTLMLYVYSTPPGAQIRTPTGSGPAPYSVEIPAKADIIQVEASLDGYEPQQSRCKVTRNDIDQGTSECELVLKKKKRTASEPGPRKSSSSEKATEASDKNQVTGYDDNPF